MSDSSIKSIPISDYNYDLPNHKIAYHPQENRELSKLLVYNNGAISEKKFAELPSVLTENDFLVFNNTRVINARLWFQKTTGKIIEIFCLEPKNEELVKALSSTQKSTWRCMVGGAKRWKTNPLIKEVEIKGEMIEVRASKGEYVDQAFEITFDWNSEYITFSEILETLGKTPLPPYIKREDTIEDEKRYQTVYSCNEGSVAAPTAGLHFSEKLIQNLTNSDIQTEYLTLHVGAGTFKPVTSDNIGEHDMHYEVFEVSVQFLENIIGNLSKRIIPVGTTSCRTLESLYWIGVKMLQNGIPTKSEFLFLEQWEAYDLKKNNADVKGALSILIEYAKKNDTPIFGKTQLMIAPGYQYKIAKGLITNFHLPKSTLLLLVSAMIGENWENVYKYALENDFRFLSYGDGSLLIP